jgi:hypothetical protein
MRARRRSCAAPYPPGLPRAAPVVNLALTDLVAGHAAARDQFAA